VPIYQKGEHVRTILALIFAALLVIPLVGALAWVHQDHLAAATTGAGSHRQLVNNADWCWFSEPRAIHFRGAHNSTYFGYVTNAGAINAGQYDHETKNLKTFTLGTFEPDDHNTPAINVLSDGKIIVFYARHQQDNALRYRISSAPEDITTLGEEHVLTTSGLTTYAQIIYKKPVIVVFYRVTVGNQALAQRWSCRVSKDNGATWGAEVPVFDYGAGEQLYMLSSWRWGVADNSAADIVLSGNPGAGGAHGVRYCYLYIAGPDSIYVAKPGQVALLDLNMPNGPIAPSDIPVVYDPSLNNQVPAWIWDVYATSPSYIYCVYATFPSDTDHRYNYARYNPTTKAFDIKSEICAAGGYIGDNAEPQYSGGLSLANRPGTQDILYASVYSWTSKTWEIVSYTSSNGGTSWVSQALTANSLVKNVRPVAVVNGTSDFAVYWEAGDYTSYTDQTMNMIV
jgi:hypothetical protein